MKKDNQGESIDIFERYISISKEYESMDEMIDIIWDAYKLDIKENKKEPLKFMLMQICFVDSMIKRNFGKQYPFTIEEFLESFYKKTQITEEVQGLIEDSLKKHQETIDANSSDGCFIATATMGDYNHHLVLDLRNFRDYYLLNNIIGRSFVKIYYFFSPPVAKLISKSQILKSLSLTFLITPLHEFVKAIFKTKGYFKK